MTPAGADSSKQYVQIPRSELCRPVMALAQAAQCAAFNGDAAALAQVLETVTLINSAGADDPNESTVRLQRNGLSETSKAIAETARRLAARDWRLAYTRPGAATERLVAALRQDAALVLQLRDVAARRV